jgi:hypothetical protein
VKDVLKRRNRHVTKLAGLHKTVERDFPREGEEFVCASQNATWKSIRWQIRVPYYRYDLNEFQPVMEEELNSQGSFHGR